MILTGAEMKALEQRAFAEGVKDEDLMEEVGAMMAEAIEQFVQVPGKCVVHFGKGHNGGDALVTARHLQAMGWRIELRPAFPRDAWAELTAAKYDELHAAADDEERARIGDWMRGMRGDFGAPVVVLDGLLGIGAGGALRGPVRDAARAINNLRATTPARVFALDLPTGLDADTGIVDPDTVQADCTLTVGFAKTGLFSDAATACVGRLAVLPLDELTLRAPDSSDEVVATDRELAPLLPLRRFELHKGQCGRVGIVAGSRGLTGAARLAAEACVEIGAGLVTLFVTEEIYPILAAATIPEVMVRPVASYHEVLEAKLDVLAIGPGLGVGRASEVRHLLEHATQPTIVDADALNILAGNPHLLDRCAGPRLLTPHPGEMARLDPGAASRSRRETVETFTTRWPHTLLLKGARTLIGQRGEPFSYNSTGTPGMATGGMGDVLTGVCAGLAGQGLEFYDAARAGAWLCGRASERAVQIVGVEETLTPTKTVQSLRQAIDDMRLGCW